MSDWQKGKKPSEACITAVKKANSHPHTPEHIAKVVASMKGKKRDPYKKRPTQEASL